MVQAGSLSDLEVSQISSQCCPVYTGQEQVAQPDPHHHRDRGYLTGVPVQPLVVAEAQMPAPANSAPAGQPIFAPPEKRIHNNADLDRSAALSLPDFYKMLSQDQQMPYHTYDFLMCNLEAPLYI